MVIKVNIPKNDWQPAKPRPEIVQQLCDIFLNKAYECRWSRKQPYIWDNDLQYTLYSHSITPPVKGVEINEAEVNAAFKALTDAGYYIHRGVFCDTGCYFYRVSKRPFIRESYVLVTTFDEVFNQ